MKKPILFICTILFSSGIIAQTLIATSNIDWATSYHSQRKIVRNAEDQIYVVFTDFMDSHRVVKGVMLNADQGEWNTPEPITAGTFPTLAISELGKIHLIYRSNDEVRKIMHMSSDDFFEWTEPIILNDSGGSCTIPVADIDSSGNLNVFWIQENIETGKDLVYCRVNGDTVSDRKTIATKEDIYDIAIANHLQYLNDEIFFALHFTSDSLQFFWSEDLMETYDTLLSTKGSQPNITFNSLFEFDDEYNGVRFLYRDTDLNLMEFEAMFDNYQNGSVADIGIENVDYFCTDDVTPPIGYSYLYLSNSTLYHNFSYGQWYNQYNMETIYGTMISYPNIAYKHFDPLFVDFVWMDLDSDIYYMHDEKHVWMPGYPEIQAGGAFSISGGPNPFSKSIGINVIIHKKNATPQVQVYSIAGKLIKPLDFIGETNGEFTYNWDGNNKLGTKVRPGIYLVVCTIGENRKAFKIMYNK